MALPKDAVPISQMPSDAVPINTQPVQNEQMKSPWSAVGAEITPQMTQEHPILSSIAQTAQDIVKIPADFGNQFLLNAPRALLNKLGYSFPDTTNPVAKTAANVAGVAGGIMNPIKIKNPLVAGAVIGSLYSSKDNIGLDTKSAINRVIGGATGAATSGLLSGIGKAFNSGDVINRFIGTRKKDFLFGKNPGQAVADEGIIASNPEDLSTKIGDKLTEYGNKISQTLSTNNSTVNISDSTKSLDEAISKAANVNDQALVTRLNDSKTAIQKILSLDSQGKIQVQGNRDLTNLSLQEATDVKRIVGEMTKFTGLPSADNISNKALLNVYGSIRNSIEKVAPEVAPLNQAYANLKSAQIAIARKDFSKTPITSTLGGVGRGAILGLLAGAGNPMGGALGAVAEPLLERATNNARTKTIQAMIYKTGEKAKNAALSNHQELLGIANILNKSNNQ